MIKTMSRDSMYTFHNGNKMPILGIGTWQLTDDTAGTIAYALNHGYPMIDTSSDYGTQPGVGDGLKKSGVKRENVYIVTKIEETDDAYRRTKSNLKELDLDYIDLMLIHRPPESGAGEMLWEGLIQAKDEGLIKDIGVSNYSEHLIQKLIDFSDETPVVNQIEWSPFGHSDQMREFCKNHEIIIQAYSPLTRTKRLDNTALNSIAEKYEKSPAQVLIRWNLQAGNCPIPKANQKAHIDENLEVFDFELSTDDMTTLTRLNEEYSSLGTLPYV